VAARQVGPERLKPPRLSRSRPPKGAQRNKPRPLKRGLRSKHKQHKPVLLSKQEQHSSKRRVNNKQPRRVAYGSFKASIPGSVMPRSELS
jgi:hypothetical protein